MNRERKTTNTIPTKRGVSYCRVSTLNQMHDSQGRIKADSSPEAQKLRCIEHIHVQESRTQIKHEIVEHLKDEGFSGKNTKRPAYMKMWELIESKKIDFIVTPELSRLSRSVMDFLEFIQHCKRHNVQVIIIGLDLDTNNPIGTVMVTILVTLAQFEREMTGQRVKENALARLINDGKINGAAEIIGLDRDPDKSGHFIANIEELNTVRDIFRLFLKSSSKKETLQLAQKQGLKGKRGKDLNSYTINTILENAKWRYRGLWYVNKKNQYKNQDFLEEANQFKTVELPHGPLIEIELLEKVTRKLDDVYKSKKRVGSEKWVYLLSHILYYEDGSRFTGQVAKNRQYRYYYNNKNKIRINCSDIDKVIIKRIKCYFEENEVFQKLVERSLKNKLQLIPLIDKKILRIERELTSARSSVDNIKANLLNETKIESKEFIELVESTYEEQRTKIQKLESDLSSLKIRKVELKKNSGLHDIAKASKELIDKFKTLTGTEKRNLIEKVVHKIIIRSDNKIVLELNSAPKRSLMDTKPSVNLEDKSTDSEVDGSRGRTRTADKVINSHLLYQLSYSGSVCELAKLSLFGLLVKS